MSNLRVLQPATLRAEYGLEAFVETGCYRGESLCVAQQAGYLQLISCDLDSQHVTKCKQTLPHAAILHGPSTALLGKWLRIMQPRPKRTLFWLDAHFPSLYGLDESAEMRYPLPEELKLIRQFKQGWQEDVIAFDDLRVIRDPKNPRWRAGELTGSDALLYMDITLRELVEPFLATHRARILLEEEGSMLLLPRRTEMAFAA